MTYYKQKLKKSWISDIIRQMALLREQRNLIRVLQDFHKDNNTEQADAEVKLGAHLGGIKEILIPQYLYNKKILLSDKKDFIIPKKGTQTYWDRFYKISNLYQSCKDDNFIVPLKIDIKNKHEIEPKLYDLGIRISSKGTDLLSNWHFFLIFLEKSKPLTLIIGAVGGVLSFIILKLLPYLIELIP